MRVCIVSIASPAHGIGGINDLTRMLGCGLRRAGHEVEVITARHPQGRREEWCDGIRWRYVDAPPFRHLDGTWMRRSYEAFLESDAEAPFDVVFGWGSSALELVRRGVHRRVPVVTNFQGNFIQHATAAVRRALRARRPRPLLAELKFLLKLCVVYHFPRGNWYCFRATETIVPSHDQLVATCRSHVLRRSRTHVVPNGIDAELFRPRPKEELRAELGLGSEPIFICVARLNKGKGVHYAVQALAELRNGASAARLVVVGDGEERERLESLAGEQRVADRVVFTGAQPQEKVASYLAASDVFLFPTGYAEAGPVSLVQAMASGLAVVASDLGAIPEVVGRDGDRGILVPAGDVGALARAMKDLLDSRESCRRIGERARERVLAEYTLERMTERMLAVAEIARARLPGNSAASGGTRGRSVHVARNG